MSLRRSAGGADGPLRTEAAEHLPQLPDWADPAPPDGSAFSLVEWVDDHPAPPMASFWNWEETSSTQPTGFREGSAACRGASTLEPSTAPAPSQSSADERSDFFLLHWKRAASGVCHTRIKPGLICSSSGGPSVRTYQNKVIKQS
ncbi:hypothetical protein CRENBAI_007008 [Crenichthys baileyi]|uniref:Uncharacterized protein n=1 Tax=Crenichthys baileyi TaxID=28760 RepID=A0AAV9RTW7_9TELE